MKYTLDTDFSSLNGPKAANWMMSFQDIAHDAFADSSSHSRLLGNLLILEPYMHTLRQGLADQGRTVPVILQKAIDPLWDYLEGKKAVSDFQDFANNLYAAVLDYNVGEEITEEQAEFSRNFVDIPWGLQSNKAADVMNAWEQVSQAPLFRQVIERIQNGLKAALSAVPEQYPALREEYRQYTILPKEYAAKLLEF